jgi:hypothetical protein
LETLKTHCRQSPVAGLELLSGRAILGFLCLERLGLQLAILLKKDLYFSFRRLEFAAARVGKLDSFFKESKRALKRDLAFLHLSDYFFQTVQALFKLGQRHAPVKIF